MHLPVRYHFLAVYVRLLSFLTICICKLYIVKLLSSLQFVIKAKSNQGIIDGSGFGQLSHLQCAKYSGVTFSLQQIFSQQQICQQFQLQQPSQVCQFAPNKFGFFAAEVFSNAEIFTAQWDRK